MKIGLACRLRRATLSSHLASGLSSCLSKERMTGLLGAVPELLAEHIEDGIINKKVSNYIKKYD